MEFEFEVLVPNEFVPCQYHVMPVGALPRVNVLSPQLFGDTDGCAGTDGYGFTVTAMDLDDVDQTLPQLAFALR